MRIVATSSENAYAWLAERERRPANPPRDLGWIWDGLPELGDNRSSLERVDWWAASKGSSATTLQRMGVRYRVNKHGGVVVAYAVRSAEVGRLAAGTIVAVKFRDLDPDARPQKYCAPGSRLKYPALPSVYGAPRPRRLFICEGESDAAWLFQRCREDGAVYCLHGGAALFSPEWLEHLPQADQVYVATDNDWDRRLGNIGEELARRFLDALPAARRLRPPFPAKDWCEVTR
jgi:hypothetical protein